MAEAAKFTWTTVDAFRKEHGEQRTLSVLKAGWRDKTYRKSRQIENDTLLELAKKNTSMVNEAKAQVAKELGKPAPKS